MRYIVVMKSTVDPSDVYFKSGKRTGGWTKSLASAAKFNTPHSAIHSAIKVGGFAPVEVREQTGNVVWASLESRESRSGYVMRDGAWVEWEGTHND